MKFYYLSWEFSFREGRFTCCFRTEHEREEFEKTLASYCKVRKWEYQVHS